MTTWPEKLANGICEEDDCEHKSCEVAYEFVKATKPLVFDGSTGEVDASDIDDSDFESVPPSSYPCPSPYPECPYQRASHGNTPPPRAVTCDECGQVAGDGTGIGQSDSPIWRDNAGNTFCSRDCRVTGGRPAPQPPSFYPTPDNPGDDPARLRRAIDAYEAATHKMNATGQKPTNPKDALGSDKLPLHLWPETATAMGSLGLLDGMLKYGRSNFRAIGVRATIYTDAAKRHINAWLEGEDNDPDSGLPHFAHALACLAILVDAGAAGKINDDRQYPGGYRGLVDALTPHVARLKAHHAGKSPRHYTIADAPNGLEDL